MWDIDKTQFLPGSGRVDTTVLMHYLDANKTDTEEARRQLHKNVASNIEQVLAATAHKTPTVRPPAPYHENYSSYTYFTSVGYLASCQCHSLCLCRNFYVNLFCMLYAIWSAQFQVKNGCISAHVAASKCSHKNAQQMGLTHSCTYMYVEKVKRKKHMFHDLFIWQHISTFFKYKSVLPKLF